MDEYISIKSTQGLTGLPIEEFIREPLTAAAQAQQSLIDIKPEMNDTMTVSQVQKPNEKIKGSCDSRATSQH